MWKEVAEHLKQRRLSVGSCSDWTLTLRLFEGLIATTFTKTVRVNITVTTSCFNLNLRQRSLFSLSPTTSKLLLRRLQRRVKRNSRDAVPEGLNTRVVCKFSCASCNACYVGETSGHFSARVRDRSSNVCRHLEEFRVLSNILHTGLLRDPWLCSYQVPSKVYGNLY